MFPIVESTTLAPGIKRLRVMAPRIARKQQAGQFVIVRVHDHGERIPLTIAAADRDQGTITLIVQGVGKTTHLLNQLQVGQQIRDVVGPLGNPADIDDGRTAVIIGGGVGAAIAWPCAAARKQAGKRVLFILGARSRDYLIVEDEIRLASDELHICTNDGSAGRKALVTDLLQELIDRGEPIDLVLAIGPIPMMRAVAEVTRPADVRTLVSLNSIMVDGTGMCGGCRVLVGGEARFACVDGPEFDAHQVDFDVLQRRNEMYRSAELEADQRFLQTPDLDLEPVRQQAGVRADHVCQLEQRHPELLPYGDQDPS